jgi:hypothetical protein
MPLQATSGAASYDAFGGGVAAVPNYIEDVFSTWLYTGNNNGSTGDQSIVNGIDLSGKGGLVWIKNRNDAQWNTLQDTARGRAYALYSNSTSGQTGPDAANEGITSFNSNGFSLGKNNNGGGNTSGYTYASWTFREQPKFFDVVTYSGNSVAGRVINHNLGSAPGVIIVKVTDAVDSWLFWHRSIANNGYARLNSTAAAVTTNTQFKFGNGTTTVVPDATSFTVGDDGDINSSGKTYVAYIFAHNAGGFGLSGTDNVISCGSFTGGATVNLGYEPQWLLVKGNTSGANWQIMDNMRGMTVGGDDAILQPNTSNVESFADLVSPTATGFTNTYNNAVTFIYIAIRRGPMKVPTTGTSVFAPVTYTGTNVDNRLVNTGLITDAIIARRRNDVVDTTMSNRLQADGLQFTNLPDDQKTYADGLDTAPDGLGNSFSVMNGFYVGNSASTNLNQASTPQLAYAFRRAPGFFDVVCYTGNGDTLNVTHNLGAVPELMIVKNRSNSANWRVYDAFNGPTKRGTLNSSSGWDVQSSMWNDTAPTSSVFTVGYSNSASGQTYVAYLFATCPGVSKVGSYTGTGTTQTINCGFTAGSRFVLIKRTDFDSDGDWYVWDSARGIVSGNDPYLLLNSTAAEVTNTDYVDTAATGFEISSTAPAALNAIGGTYLFLAIA